jgi:hypothetical protein
MSIGHMIAVMPWAMETATFADTRTGGSFVIPNFKGGPLCIIRHRGTEREPSGNIPPIKQKDVLLNASASLFDTGLLENTDGGTEAIQRISGEC